ncbi:hypothetical protein BO94DRAFT_628096 [Aspergillus sclerotioniger CBS 115572]|uniref:Uncharacterized protein n=1 Tax=Aspergillus sclerotioniger CBS 115572 TaxID=1450535 RepID=A0A317VBI6_9EURO|nr:hypothetical protein BO94DRAFT_628096 [Aspergillus sclerotioniger CBS 115572]PWY71586.1 hypothetical protein BO94DRAFT_628096 [Aspergillus sclerotioniger CBS 115572]
MTWISVLTTIFNGTLYPLAFLAGWGYGLIRVLALPLLHLGHAVLHLALFPLRLFAKFEAILSFIGTAVLTGAVLGLAIYLITTCAIEMLHRWIGSFWNTPSRRRGGGSQRRRLLEAIEGAPSFSPSDSNSSDEYLMEWYDRQDRQPQNDGTIVEEEESS